MRLSKERGAIIRNVSTELSLDEHQKLKAHAEKKGSTIGRVIRDAIMPIIEKPTSVSVGRGS